MANAGGVEAIPAELLAELERLRSLEKRLKSEHRQMRAEAETEIARLHAALRQTADRVREREREIERLNAKLDGDDGDRQPAAKLLARLEQDRRALEERARAVAESESRQREAQAKLAAETKRLAELRRSLESAPSPDLGERLHAEAIRQKDELQARTAVALPLPAAEPAPASPTKRERELVRREEELTRREIRLALLRRKIGEAELRLSERAWRSGALGSPGDGAADMAASAFADGLRGMGLTKRFVTDDGGS